MTGADAAHRALLSELSQAAVPTRDGLVELGEAVEAFGDDLDRLRSAMDGATAANSLEAIMSAAVGIAVATDDLTQRVSAIITRAQVLRDAVTASASRVRCALADAFEATGAPYAETSTHRAHPVSHNWHLALGPDLPAEYYRDREPVPDKRRIRAEMDAGKTIPGATKVQAPPSVIIKVRTS